MLQAFSDAGGHEKLLVSGGSKLQASLPQRLDLLSETRLCPEKQLKTRKTSDRVARLKQLPYSLEKRIAGASCRGDLCLSERKYRAFLLSSAAMCGFSVNLGFWHLRKVWQLNGR